MSGASGYDNGDFGRRTDVSAGAHKELALAGTKERVAKSASWSSSQIYYWCSGDGSVYLHGTLLLPMDPWTTERTGGK